VAHHHEATGGRQQIACEQPHQGGFAGTVGAEQAEDLAAADPSSVNPSRADTAP